jgi:enoyl-CoA hydratase/carnithine racemase
MEMVLTGAPIGAREALQLHLVNRVVPESQLMDEALKLAQTIADNAPLAVRESRDLVQAAYDDNDASLSRRGVEAVMRLMGSKDTREGTRAFLEKRKPRWAGR